MSYRYEDPPMFNPAPVPDPVPVTKNSIPMSHYVVDPHEGMPSVDTYYDAVQNNILLLQQAIDHLHDRLHPFLVPHEVAPPLTPATKTEERSPFREVMDDLMRQMNDQVTRLQSLAAAIDI